MRNGCAYTSSQVENRGRNKEESEQWVTWLVDRGLASVVARPASRQIQPAVFLNAPPASTRPGRDCRVPRPRRRLGPAARLHLRRRPAVATMNEDPRRQDFVL